MSVSLAKVLELANSQIGYRESGNNDTKYNHDLGTIDGTYGYPWCQSFQSWLQKHAGGVSGTDYPRTASCFQAVSWFKSHKRFSQTPHVGDMVFYGPGGSTHVELVTKVGPDYITTIGGNTSGSLGGRYFNGDGVYKKNVSRSSDRIYGYGSPVYGVPVSVPSLPKPLPAPVVKPKPASPAVPSGSPLIRRGQSGARVKALQAALNAYYQPIPKLVVDGDFGPATEGVLKRFQKFAHTTADGVYGPVTAAKLDAYRKARH